MTNTHFAVGQVLFREGDPADSVFRLLSGAVDIFRELNGEPILLGTVGAGQFIGEMGVVENRPRSATARAASEVEVEILAPAEFFDPRCSTTSNARTRSPLLYNSTPGSGSPMTPRWSGAYVCRRASAARRGGWVGCGSSCDGPRRAANCSGASA
jgi:hypothetical protein